MGEEMLSAGKRAREPGVSAKGFKDALKAAMWSLTPKRELALIIPEKQRKKYRGK